MRNNDLHPDLSRTTLERSSDKGQVQAAGAATAQTEDMMIAAESPLSDGFSGDRLDCPECSGNTHTN